MIDPRFVTTGAVPFASGYGTQQVSYQQQQQVPYQQQQQVPYQQQQQQVPYQQQQQQQYQHHHHHHHHHRRSNQNGTGDSPLSRDESIHKVDHGHHNIQQNDGAPFSGGYGVPYNAGAFGVAGAPGGYYSQQPPSQFAAGNYGFNNQYQGNVYDQGQFAGGPGAPVVKQRRRHHRHHRNQAEETVTGSGVADQAQGVPEQLIGQRSSSVLGNEAPQVGSPAPTGEGETVGEQTRSRRHRHRRHHQHQQNSQQASFGQTQLGHTSAGADGYGHINDELIFIERGEHSPHRQEPPPGYEYKGKIEVQNIDKTYRSQSQGQSGILPPVHPSVPVVQPSVPVVQPSVPIVQPSVPVAQPTGPCPPGWQQMILTAAPGGPCPPGATVYTGQLSTGAGAGAGAGPGAGVPQPTIGGLTGFGGSAGGIGFGGAGPIGASGSGAGLANLAASLPFPPQGQLIADYIVESSAGGVSSSGGSGFLTDYQQTAGGSSFLTDFQQTAGGSFTSQVQSSQVEENVTTRPTIIEVWQKRGKPDAPDRSPSPPRPSGTRSTFDFEKFRADILDAIERMVQNNGSGAKIQWTGHDGGTQTQIHPSTTVIEKKEVERRTTGSNGEVRVIVQPIQPVFYMPRQGETTRVAPPPTTTTTSVGPAIQHTSGGTNVVYVPRNVYVPVIKPVFVPRERVIVRPQVIHVARPVLVDRPVPVTQRPIIIDRERPVPVPTRGGSSQGLAQTSSSSNVQQDFGYQDNLPVSYGGQSTEFTNNVNYEYAPTQQEQQYTTNSTHEFSGQFQAQAPVLDVPVTEQFQHSQSASHIDVQSSGASYHEPYPNLQQTSSASYHEPYPNLQQASSASYHESYPNLQQASSTSYHESYPNLQQASSASFHESYPNLAQTSSASYRESYSNLAQTSSASAINVTPLACAAPIDVLDTTVNPSWQRTDKTTLVQRYGRPAYDIVQRTDQVEQQMYQELRQRTSSGGIQRSSSGASYGSGSGLGAAGGIGGGASYGVSSSSYSNIASGDLQNFHAESYNQRSSSPVCVNY